MIVFCVIRILILVVSQSPTILRQVWKCYICQTNKKRERTCNKTKEKWKNVSWQIWQIDRKMWMIMVTGLIIEFVEIMQTEYRTWNVQPYHSITCVLNPTRLSCSFWLNSVLKALMNMLTVIVYEKWSYSWKIRTCADSPNLHRFKFQRKQWAWVDPSLSCQRGHFEMLMWGLSLCM